MFATPNLNATHLPFLLACLRKHPGPMLELGMGLFSTPLFHTFVAGGRYCRSVETNPAWAARLKALWEGVPMEGEHEVVLIGADEMAPLEDRHWSVALVDHEGRRRAPDLTRLKDRADLIVVHDAVTPGYEMVPVLDTFKFRFVTPNYHPATAVVSNLVPVDWVEAAVGNLW